MAPAGVTGQKKAKEKRTPSREQCKCPVEGCTVEKRRDKMLLHLISTAKFDTAGNPLIPHSQIFNKLDEKERKHTEYFHHNNFKETTSIKAIHCPPVQETVRQKLSPFDQMTAALSKKRKR